MKKCLLFFILVTSYLLLVTNCSAIELSSTKGVGIFAGIEDNRVTNYGFTSPTSRVTLSNPKVYALTFSKDNGYFEFDRIILPKNPGELCLFATDNDSRQTNPVCIPAPPQTKYFTSIGPIILPPTITVDTETLTANSTSAASGQSIPFSNITVYLYQLDNNAPIFPKPASAISLPGFQTKTDAQGNYSLSLPTSYSSDFRLFSTVLFASQPSPKSNTINYQLPSIQNNYLFIPLFIITLFVFGYLLYLYFWPKKQPRYLPAVFHYPLIKYSILNTDNL